MVEHVAIADAARHEPKHASTALAGQHLKANGDGSTRFELPTYAELSGKPTSRSYTNILLASSTATTQAPSVVGVPLKVEYGASQATPDVTLTTAGDLTFLTGGDYLVTMFLRFGRTTATGDAFLYHRLLLNGTQVLNSNGLRLGNTDIVVPFSFSIALTVTAGQVFTTEILRDSSGANNGGLFRLVPALADWAPSPSATLSVSKFTGLV